MNILSQKIVDVIIFIVYRYKLFILNLLIISIFFRVKKKTFIFKLYSFNYQK